MYTCINKTRAKEFVVREKNVIRILVSKVSPYALRTVMNTRCNKQLRSSVNKTYLP